MVSSFHERLERSPVAKAVLAVGIFGLIIAGWVSWRHYREHRATLPNAAQQSDACSLWFIGSSSIHRWKSLNNDMHPWKSFNRGIDDAAFSNLLPRFANSAEEPKPAAIILYAGENDIARGTPVPSVVGDLAEFLRLRRAIMSDVPVLVLSMKPSPGRWKNVEAQRSFNVTARQLLAKSHQAYYGDITTPLLTGGRLGDNYRADGVHMNAAGYQIWTRVVRQRLRDILPASATEKCDPSGK